MKRFQFNVDNGAIVDVYSINIQNAMRTVTDYANGALVKLYGQIQGEFDENEDTIRCYVTGNLVY